MDGAIDTASSREAGIGGMPDRPGILLCNIPLDHFEDGLMNGCFHRFSLALRYSL
jgi:hypothetical protein